VGEVVHGNYARGEILKGLKKGGLMGKLGTGKGDVEVVDSEKRTCGGKEEGGEESGKRKRGGERKGEKREGVDYEEKF